ncbi:chemotaxis protein CheV [Thiorhodococcus mannitoliphagus]|uniref:Chemotaxis protein CheV n=1 Tax=Thiorhodococcus mannitoliphagus TaxID=329406 RepID=A0A6P1DWH8_9GAMM|nr:chemotaxis protein [Thiorhodococcus mannitoliphagus]NEX21076.1 chemotaxis protein CheV [Thiorhodococcus mannitoliphagus]
MSQFIDDVDQRTRLVGQNRMELLLFHLGSEQAFGINVFKVREVIAKPALRHIPGSSPVVCGVANIRGKTVSIIDLAQAIGFPSPEIEHDQDAKVIVTEFNRSVQGFWVSAVDRIVNVTWENVKPPPRGTGQDSYLVAVTEVDGHWVEIIDVERVFAQVNQVNADVSEAVQKEAEGLSHDRRILVVDDSLVARKQVERAIAELGFRTESRSDGKAALEYLEELADADMVDQHIELIIADIEMPRMDGYTLTRKIRENAKLKNLRVVLHSSLSGQFNIDMVKRAGADDFLAKFDPDDLAATVLRNVRSD